MHRLKDLINNFKKPLNKIIKNDYILQKSAPKYNPTAGYYNDKENSYSKGVENDFLRIFNTYNGKSFAIIYNNINKPIEEVLISLSIEEDKKNIMKTYTFEEFRTLLKECINTLNILDSVKSLNEDSLYITLEKTFKLKDKIDVNTQVTLLVNKIKTQTDTLQKDLNSVDDSLSIACKLMDEKQMIIDKQVKSAKRKEKYNKLEKEFHAASSAFQAAKFVVHEVKSNLEKELNTYELNSKIIVLKRNVKDFKRQIDNVINEQSRPFGKDILKQVEDTINK